MGQIKWTISIVFIFLFTIAVLGFAISFAQSNNSPIDISNNVNISNVYNSTTDSADTLTGNLNSSATSILQTTIPEGSDTAQSSGSFSIGINDMVSAVKTIFLLAYTEIFGGNPVFFIFFFVLVGTLLFIGALYIWRTLKAGNPD